MLREGQNGACRVRGVRGGDLAALGFGMISSGGVDPIEKKPLYHFHPGKPVFSVGGWGCNLGCEFCQNWTISQQFPDGGERRSPADVVRQAGRQGSIGVAYTYNEPLITADWAVEIFKLAKAEGIRCGFVSNGNATPEVLEAYRQYHMKMLL